MKATSKSYSNQKSLDILLLKLLNGNNKVARIFSFEQLLFSKVVFTAIAGGQVKPMRNISSVKKVAHSKILSFRAKIKQPTQNGG